MSIFTRKQGSIKGRVLDGDKSLHEATFLLLGACVLNGLEGQQLLRLHLEQLLKQLVDVGSLLGRGFDVFALPHFLQEGRDLVTQN